MKKEFDKKDSEKKDFVQKKSVQKESGKKDSEKRSDRKYYVKKDVTRNEARRAMEKAEGAVKPKSTDKSKSVDRTQNADKPVRPARGQLFCKISDKCGGCQYLAIPYAEQLAEKQKKVRILLDKYCKVDPIIGMDKPLYYRNKVTATVGRRKDGTYYSGIYEERSHNILQNEKCYIENELSGKKIGRAHV